MYLKKNTPEEILESIRLRMIYSTSKTLNENLKVIKEQSEQCPNSISYEELKQLGIDAGNIVKKMDASFVRMGYGEERANELYNIIKSLIGKNVFDDITNECVNAIEKFKQSFKQTGSRGWFESGFDLEEKIRDFSSGYYENEPEVLRYLNATTKLLNQSSKKDVVDPNPQNPGNSRQQNINNAYCNLSKDTIITGGFFKGKTWDFYARKYNITPEEIEVAKSSCTKKGYTPPKPIYTYCKSFPFKQKCKNRLIIEVQSCLGLPKKHQTGNFGPITLKSLNERLKSLGKAETSEITEDVYRIIIQNCNGSSDIEPSKRTTEPVQLDGPKRPSTSIGYDLPTTINGGPVSAPNVSGEQLFKAYLDVKDLYKRGDDWVFKGKNMTKDNLDKVSEYLRDQGYRTLEKGDKPYGEKFVWKR